MENECLIFAGLFLPHLITGLTEQSTVAWIYLFLVAMAAGRTWLTLNMLFLSIKDKRHFVEKTHVFSELTVNLPVIFGVMGTLIGVSEAVAVKFGTQDTALLEQGSQAFIEAFSGSFSIAITTTIVGGIVHAYSFLLSSFDHWIAESTLSQEYREPLCDEED